VHLVRCDRDGSKIMTPVRVTEQMRVDEFDNEARVRGSRRYELLAVVVHIGETIADGHFAVFVRFAGVWWLIFDHGVRRVNARIENAVLRFGQAHLALYAEIAAESPEQQPEEEVPGVPATERIWRWLREQPPQSTTAPAQQPQQQQIAAAVNAAPAALPAVGSQAAAGGLRGGMRRGREQQEQQQQVPRGFLMGGHRCFANAGLAMLLSVPCLRAAINAVAHPLLAAAAAHYAGANGGTHDLTQLVQWYAPQLADGQPHDAAEFVNALLNGVPEWRRLVAGTTATTLQCIECGTSRRVDVAPWLMMQVVVPIGAPPLQLSALIADQLRPTHVECRCDNGACTGGGGNIPHAKIDEELPGVRARRPRSLFFGPPAKGETDTEMDVLEVVMKLEVVKKPVPGGGDAEKKTKLSVASFDLEDAAGMTINKAQGLNLRETIVDLSRPVDRHVGGGLTYHHIYTALSRVTRLEELRHLPLTDTSGVAVSTVDHLFHADGSGKKRIAADIAAYIHRGWPAGMPPGCRRVFTGASLLTAAEKRAAINEDRLAPATAAAPAKRAAPAQPRGAKKAPAKTTVTKGAAAAAAAVPPAPAPKGAKRRGRSPTPAVQQQQTDAEAALRAQLNAFSTTQLAAFCKSAGKGESGTKAQQITRLVNANFVIPADAKPAGRKRGAHKINDSSTSSSATSDSESSSSAS
jgi:hypothetical protein